MTTTEHIAKLLEYIKTRHFSLPSGFIEAVPDELILVYNGVGAEWMPQFVRRIITKSFPFLESWALIHDYEFANKNKSYFAFSIANLRLFYNACVDRHPVSGAVCAACCQFFGWSAWIEGKDTIAFCYYLEENKK